MCFFGDEFFSETSTSRYRNVVLQHTHTHTHKHTHTHTHTHMTGQPWLTGQVVPEGFSGFANIFDHKWSARIFFLTARGSRNIRKYLQSVTNVFSCLCLYMYAGTMLQIFKGMLGKLLKCKAQLLEINCAPTAG